MVECENRGRLLILNERFNKFWNIVLTEFIIGSSDKDFNPQFRQQLRNCHLTFRQQLNNVPAI